MCRACPRGEIYLSGSDHKASLPTLIIGAIGVVYGDIGTSPLYAMKETFAGHHPLAVTEANVFGVLSLLFWTVMLLVTIKYVAVIMRADNRGEGGSLALLALVTELTKDNPVENVTSETNVTGITPASTN